jgi:hypothetical protein
MLPLSPVDAIGPAFNRARNLLLRDFHLGRFLKVALVAALTEGMGGGGSYNYSGSRGHGPFPFPTVSPEQLHLMVVAAVAVLVVGVPILLLFLYLSARFTFVTFDMVLMQRPFVRPGWEGLRRPGNRYFGLRLVIMLAELAVLLLALFLLFPGIQTGYHGGGWSRLIRTALEIAPFYLVYFLGLLLFKCFLATTVVPRMAIEDDSISESMRKGWDDVRPDVGRFIVYFLLRGAISLAIVILSFFVAVLAIVVVGLLMASIVFALYHFLWAGGVIGKTSVILVGVLLGLTLFVAYFAAIVSLAGFRNIFRQAYAQLFYGGYYPMLGNLLAAGPISTPNASPAFSPPPDLPPPQAIW